MSQPVELKKKLYYTVIAAAIAASLGTNQAFAQEEEEDPKDSEEVVEEAEEEETRVTVTGSRISRPEFSSISPVQVIDGEIARDLGLFDAADLLQQTTVVQGQQITTGVSTSAGLLTDNGPGSATASLRGLDAGRTLTMINGRRLAPAGVRGAPSNPDLNMIPGSLIERVDILLDGASSVYGSDAVAGVVNYVLRNDFDGMQVDYYTDNPTTVDGGKQTVLNLTWGANSDRGFMGFAAEYSRTEGYKESAFADFYQPYQGDCLSRIYQGASGELYESCIGSFGAGSASGVPGIGFAGFDPTFQRQTPGMPRGWFQIPISADLLTPGSVNGAALLLWPEEFEAAFAPDFERKSFYSYGEYSPGWAGDATTYFEASWANRLTNTNTRGQGFIRLPGDYALGSLGQNPNDPSQASSMYYGNTFINDTEVSQTRMVFGIKGDIPALEDVGSLTNWSYDGYFSYSRSMGSDRVQGIPFFPRLQATLTNTRIDPVTGEAVCDPYTAPGYGQTVECRPLNFLDPLFVTTGRFQNQSDNDWLFPNRMTYTIVEQKVASAYVTGELFDLPSGLPASLVVGFEYREDGIETYTDAGASGGDFIGFSGDPGANGDRWLREYFAEVDLPLLSDMDFVNDLSLNVAFRGTEEENFGSETTYRAQLRYAPVEWLSFRGSVGTSFRAPNLGEQFGGAVTGFANPQDPCRTPGITVPFDDYDNDPNTPDTREYNPSLENRDQVVLDNCLNGGGPFNIPATDPFSLGIRGLGTTSPVFFGSPTRVASGSNPELEAETSEATTYGIVFEQPWTDAMTFNFSASYFEIEIDGEVDSLSASTIVNRCYNSVGLSDPTCAFVTRDPRDPAVDTSGEISFVSALNQNLGKQRVRGIDYNIELGTDFAIPGLEDRINYSLVARATRALEDEEEEFTVDGINIDNDLNEYGNPKWRLTLTNVFGFGDWTVLLQSRYLDAMIEDNDPDQQNEETNSFFNPCVQAGDQPCLQYDGLDDYWVHNMSAAWRSDDLIVRFGVSNIFDEAPPLTDNSDIGSLGGVGYDIGGRTFFTNITVAF